MPQRTAREQELLEKASSYLPGGNNGNVNYDPDHAFIVKEGKGSRIWDVSGNEYIDYLMGSGPEVLGHAHPAVVAAAVEAAEKGSTFFAINEYAVLLAEEIVRAVACADTVRFTMSGTDACFNCLRIARSFRRREKILKFEGGYHGMSDYAVISVNPSRAQLKEFPQPVVNSGGVPQAAVDSVLVAPYNDAEMATAIIEKHHDELAAVIVEPMQRLLAPKPGFLQALRDATAHYEVPLIFDEVVTGFRLAYGGGQQYYGVTPDLASLGKIVGGGFPLSAVAGREEIMSVFDKAVAGTDSYVPQIGTFNAHPVSCAAGLATLAELRKEGAYDRLHATGRRLRDALERMCREAEIPMQPAGEDPIFGFYFTDQPISDYRSTLTGDTAMMTRFNQILMEQGILKSWPDKFYPSLAHTTEDVDRTIEVFESAIEKLKG